MANDHQHPLEEAIETRLKSRPWLTITSASGNQQHIMQILVLYRLVIITAYGKHIVALIASRRASPCIYQGALLNAGVLVVLVCIAQYK